MNHFISVAKCPYSVDSNFLSVPAGRDSHFFSPVENVVFSAEEAEDPFKFINARFQQIYKTTKRVILSEKVQKCVIVTDGMTLTFFTDGVRSKSASIITPLYDHLKTVAHIPFCIYLLLDPFTQKREKVFPREQLKKYGELVKELKSFLPQRFKWTAYFGKNLLPTQEKIIELSLEFIQKILEAHDLKRTQLIEFCRICTPYLKENIKNAAIAEINELHKEVMEYKESLNQEQWNHVHVVIMGPHMARKGYLITQYFARLLDISEDEDRRLIFAEGFADEELALDLLATNATDTEASEAFFEDPEFMHSDVLSTATEEYLDELFDRAKNVYAAIAQVFLIDSDNNGNYRRIRAAAERASKGGADLICFPEGVLRQEGSNSAEELLTKIASHFQIYVSAGIIDGDQHVGILVDDQGKVIMKAKEGEDPIVVSTDHGKISVIFGRSVTEENILQKLKESKPDILVIHCGLLEPKDKWPIPKGKGIPSLASEIAKKLSCTVIAVNSVSASSYEQWSDVDDGISVSVNPGGEILQSTPPCEHQVKMFKISLADKAELTSMKWQQLKRLMKRTENVEEEKSENQEV